MPYVPGHDNVQEIIEIAKRVQSSVALDNFSTVFNAIIQVRYSRFMSTPYTIEINQGADTATAQAIRDVIKQAHVVHIESVLK